ncbi:hypothetical protein H4S02_001125 [Coemansia sp. RSA 2611]|nr:hypothetical protein H4S02_001125 [Coemansia sp. RSA 2611]
MHDTLVDISAGQAPRLKSFSLTHFQYQDGDHFGMLLALISLAPIFLIVSETSIILSRREMAGVLLLLGQLLNELLNLIIKLIIREPRPHEHLGDGYGMPSSHAQFMGFFVVYVVVYLETRVVMHQVHRRVVQAGSLVLGGLVLISRVYLGYHTVRQVLAGAIVGAGTGAVWYALVENCRVQFVDKC